MKKIYSKIDKSLLLHQISSLEDAVDGRLDLADPKEFLQASLIKIGTEKIIPKHKHVWRDGEKKVITQESWIVLRGKMKCTFYDTDDTAIEDVTLSPGDCSVTFQGGHRITILEKGTIFYEIKSGPYKGKTNDSVNI